MGRFNATNCLWGPFPVARFRHSLMRVCGLLAVTGVLNLASASAADQADSKEKNGRQIAAAGDQKDDSGSVAIPESLRKLNLSDKQKAQIQQIIRDYDGSIDNVWTQFRDRYMQTIKTESSMLAAIEDHLTDTQRQKIRDHRRRTAQHVRVNTSTTDKTNEKPSVTVKTDQTGDKPATQVDVDLANVGVSLTPEQETHADKIHQKYRTHFKSLNREIHSLHNRLVSLETEKLAEIEQVLTKDQLDQLRTTRQSPSESPRITLRVDESQ